MADAPSPREVDILRERTRAVAEPFERPEGLDRAHAIDFVVAGQRHATTFEVLQGVVPVGPLTPIPRAPPEVAGLMLHEGMVVPVFELAVLLELPARPAPERSTVLLIGRDRVEVGLRVDEVGGLLTLPAEPTAHAGAAAADWVQTLGPDAVPIVDGARLLASDRLYVDVAPSAPPARGAAP